MTVVNKSAEYQALADSLHYYTAEHVAANMEATAALRGAVQALLAGKYTALDVFALMAWLMDMLETHHETPAMVQIAALAKREGGRLSVFELGGKPS